MKPCLIGGITDFRRKTDSGLSHSQHTVPPCKGKTFRNHRGLCLYSILADLHHQLIAGLKPFRLPALLQAVVSGASRSYVNKGGIDIAYHLLYFANIDIAQQGVRGIRLQHKLAYLSI